MNVRFLGLCSYFRAGTSLVALCFIALAADSAYATDGTWTGALNNDFTNGANWTSSPFVPDGKAIFSSASRTNLDFSSSATIQTLTFSGGAPAYTFSILGGGSTVFLTGSGIVDNSANAPTINLGGRITQLNQLFFQGSASAGDAIINGDGVGEVDFFNNSTGGSAAFNPDLLSRVDFSSSSGPAGDKKVTAGSIAGPGYVYLGSDQLTVGGNNSSTVFSGVISDSGRGGGAGGSLVKIGTGILTLTSATDVSTYTGGTSITGGLINFNSLNNFGTGNITLNGGGLQWSSGITLDVSPRLAALGSGGGIFDTNGNNVSFASVISGTGGLTKVGAGTLTLKGINTYSGGTNVSGGTLQLSGSGTLGATSGNLGVSGGTLDLGSTSDTTGALTLASGTLQNGTLISSSYGVQAGAVSAVLSGSGSLTKSGGGTVTLSGVDTFTGGTTITAGTLALSGSGSIAASNGVADADTLDISATTSGASIKSLSGAGAVVLGGKTLTLTNAAGTFSGVVSGTGGFGVSAGTEILTGANTYTGGTTISGGTLQLGNGGSSGSITGNIANSGTLTFNRSDTALVIGGVISGSGSLVMNGSGLVTLNAVNTYTGGTTVTNGVLFIGDASHPNASIAGSVTVSGSGTVRGHGVTGALTNNNGTVNPGGSIGTLTVSSYSQGAGGTLVEEISPTAASELISTGPASLNGSLILQPDPGTYTAGTTYTLVSAAGGISGTFSAVNLGTGYGANISPTLSYTANAVLLTLKTSFIPFCPNATTSNQTAVCAGVTAGGASSALYGSLESVVTASAAGVAPALDALSGEIYPGLRMAMISDGRLIRQSVLEHLEGAQSDDAMLWGDAFASTGTMDGNGNTAHIGQNDNGLIAGLDAPLGDGFRAGVALAWSNQKLAIPGRASSATGQSNHVIVYASLVQDVLSLTAGVDYGEGANEVRRSVAFLSHNDTSHAGNHTTQLFGEAGYSVKTESVMVEPYANLAWLSASTGAFAETGGASSVLSGASKISALGYSTLGAHFMPDAMAMGDVELMPRISFGWQHALSGMTPAQKLTFIATAQSFQVLGAQLSTDAIVAQLGFDVAIADQGKLSLGYDGLISDHEKEHAVRAQFHWAF